MKKVVSITTSILLWIGAILGVLTITISTLSVIGVVKPLVVATGSMSPTFDAGSFIISVNKPAIETEVGDIVTVPRSDGVLVTHRVAGIEVIDDKEVSLTLKGDANRNEDVEPYVVSEIGHPLIIVPFVGSIIAALNNFKFIAISAVAGGILIWVIWGFNNKSTNIKEEKEE